MGCCGKKTKENSYAKKIRLYDEAVESGLPKSLAYKYAGFTIAEIENMT